ncbi:hypothetical protein C2G38_2107887 [Gigaspora rosea]|uniref:Uncharacterized protein n=1 Tax=Gigaspora rosea TaxID=44941 RepID=A0A397UQJ5_9GLOM|nr:hypothetical protein C2G38_2107887 [Gigaspora rosea]
MKINMTRLSNITININLFLFFPFYYELTSFVFRLIEFLIMSRLLCNSLYYRIFFISNIFIVTKHNISALLLLIKFNFPILRI